MLKQILLRDINYAWTTHGAAASGLAFFGMCYALIVMALGVDKVAPLQHAILCICLLLTVMLSLPSMLEEDARDGTLEQYLLLPLSKSWLMLTKIMAYWFSHILPLLIIAGLIQWAQMGIQTPVADGAMCSRVTIRTDLLRLFLLSLWLASLGGVSASLALLHARGTFARAMVIIPLYLPALIIATLPDEHANMLLLQVSATLVLVPFAAWIGGYLLALASD